MENNEGNYKEIQGDLNDRMKKDMAAQIAMSGTCRFSMNEVVAYSVSAQADCKPTQEDIDDLWPKHIAAVANKMAGSKKKMGKTVLRAIRKGSVITEKLKQNALLQVGKDEFILCKHADHQDLNDARYYWEVGCKQSEVRDNENRADFDHILQLEFSFLGEIM